MHKGVESKDDSMTSQADRFRIGMLLPVADLYHRLWSDIDDALTHLASDVADKLQKAGLDVVCSSAVSLPQQVTAACDELVARGVDLLLVAMAPYCPSGVLAPALAQSPVPVLLWPMQSIFKLNPQKYDADAIKLNHGVHAVQDLANVLGKAAKPFGVIHGHQDQREFLHELKRWAQAGRIIRAMQAANPVQVGGHFAHMLDLQVGQDEFIRRMGIKLKAVSTSEFAGLLAEVTQDEIDERVEQYRRTFEMGPGVSDLLLAKTARGEAALRAILTRAESHACGLNFLELCNHEQVADGLHVAASMLMHEGLGYAGEGDWVTAVLVRGMQQGLGVASFSEIFTIGYDDNRLLLKHWGEGNFAMARDKPRLLASKFTDRCAAEFAICDFEFRPGNATLVNLNSTPDGKGQLIGISGRITEHHLPNIDGPRAVFKPLDDDVREVLTEYAYAGGSHHMALVKGSPVEVLENVCRLAGWSCRQL
jgi:L-arabinose isomerase